MSYEKGIAYAKKYGFVFLCGLLTVLCIYVCFARLDYARIQNWDEARHGVNAYEMMQNHNYIVNTYNYQNDYFNLKPPLSYWGIILGFKIFGVNVFGMRFYAALSMVLTFVLVAFWLYRRVGKAACLTSMFLFLTFYDMFYWHAARNADADSLYILLFTFGCLNLIDSMDKQNKLYLCGLMFALGFLAKSWHACVMLPIGGLFMIISGLWKKWKVHQYLLFAVSALGPIFLWAVVRYHYDGMAFLGQMFGVDVTDRIAWSASSNADYSFFVKYLSGNAAFLIMMAVIVVCILFLFFSRLVLKKKNVSLEEKKQLNPRFMKSAVLALALWIIVPLMIFSFSHTYYYWYIFPIYPALCIAASLLVDQCVRFCRDRNRRIALAVVMFIPFLVVLRYDRITVRQIEDLEFSGFQQDVEKAMGQYPQLHGSKIYVEKNDNEYKDSYCWEQAELLMAELSGDLRCEDGGVEAFLASADDALLMVDTYFYEMYAEKLEAYPVLYQNEYILLGNGLAQEAANDFISY